MKTLAGSFETQQQALTEQGKKAVSILKSAGFDIPFEYGVSFTDRD